MENHMKKSELRQIIKEEIQIMKEWHEDDVAGFAFALLLMLDFNPDKKYLDEVKKLAKADEVWKKGNTVILEFHSEKGYLKAAKFAKDNYLI